MKKVRWSPRMRAINKDPSKYYAFHKDTIHWASDCRHLKRELESLLSKGHLRDLIGKDPTREMI